MQNAFRFIVSIWKDNIKLDIRETVFQGLFICSWLTVVALCSRKVNTVLTGRGLFLSLFTSKTAPDSEIYTTVRHFRQYNRTHYQFNTVCSVVTVAFSDTPYCKTIHKSRTGSFEITEEFKTDDSSTVKQRHVEMPAQIFYFIPHTK
jgi:hypothetical protein